MDKKPDIFSYIEYQEYLDDVTKYLIKTNTRFSMRVLAKESGSSVPNFIQQIINKTRKLGTKNISPLGLALKHSQNEQNYFEKLIKLYYAKSHKEQNEIYREILSEYKVVGHEHLLKTQYTYFEEWYNPIVRELITHPSYNDDELWVLKRIYPRITSRQLKKSIQLLEELGLIFKENNAWVNSSKIVQTPSQVPSSVLANYHRAVIAKASESIEKFDSESRDIRSVTARLSLSQFNELQVKMEKMWEEVLNMAEDETNSEDVYQINLQLFPMTYKGRKA